MLFLQDMAPLISLSAAVTLGIYAINEQRPAALTLSEGAHPLAKRRKIQTGIRAVKSCAPVALDSRVMVDLRLRGVIARLYIGLGPIRCRARIDQDDPVRQSGHADRQKGRSG